MTVLFEVHGVAVRWRFENLDDVFLDTSQSLDLLRIVQEALTNALRHSGANRVEVTISSAAGVLALEVRDNGSGFEAGMNGPEGTGMRSMRARARRLHADLTVESSHAGVAMRLRMERSASEQHPARPESRVS